MFRQLFKVGMRDDNPEYLNRKIYHTNVVAFIFILTFVPFTYITYPYFPSITWLPILGLCMMALTLPLNYFGFTTLSRINFSVLPISMATMYVALITPADQTPWGQLWCLYFVFIFIPTTIIDYKEPRLLIAMLGYGCLLILLWQPLNGWLEIPPFEDVQIWKTGWFGYLTIVMALAASLGSVLSMMYRSSLTEERAMALLKANHEMELLNAELKAVRAQFNPHFIFNALASMDTIS